MSSAHKTGLGLKHWGLSTGGLVLGAKHLGTGVEHEG